MLTFKQCMAVAIKSKQYHWTIVTELMGKQQSNNQSFCQITRAEDNKWSCSCQQLIGQLKAGKLDMASQQNIKDINKRIKGPLINVFNSLQIDWEGIKFISHIQTDRFKSYPSLNQFHCVVCFASYSGMQAHFNQTKEITSSHAILYIMSYYLQTSK